jgi:hypothetical protein
MPRALSRSSVAGCATLPPTKLVKSLRNVPTENTPVFAK